MQYPASELVLDGKGNVYHLGISPSKLAQNIILVGDQDRVSLVSNFFDTIEHKSQHREFVCHTGTYKGKRITALSTGIGTDNIDIVVNELDALVNIDLENRVDRNEKTSLNLVRIGTSGILQKHIPVHSFILSEYAFGLDNVAHFYPISFSPEELEINEQLKKQVNLPDNIIPYLVKSSQELFFKFSSDQTFSGITVTSSGFYAPQGRALRLGTKAPEVNEQLETFHFKSLRVTNFEMESSALFALGKSLGHRCATICLGVANRPNLEFSKGYNQEMNALIAYVLERI